MKKKYKKRGQVFACNGGRARARWRRRHRVECRVGTCDADDFCGLLGIITEGMPWNAKSRIMGAKEPKEERQKNNFLEVVCVLGYKQNKGICLMRWGR